MMHPATCTRRAGLLLTVLCCISVDARAQDASCAHLPEVLSALEGVAAEGTPLVFSLDGAELPRGGHVQGIQMQSDPAGRRNLAFLSHDSETVGYLLVVEFPQDLDGPGKLTHVQRFPSDGETPPLRHAGGIQLCGNVLAVGLEDNQDKMRSEVQFWNVARPERPRQLAHLTVRRSGNAKDMTSGAVGLIEREGDHLLAVANWDSRAIDFYRSNGKPLEDAQCRFEFSARWQNDTAEKSDWQPDPICGSYQAINLLADGEGRLYLLGFDTAFPNQDVADLFAVDPQAPPTRLIRKIAQHRMQFTGDVHFRFGSGAWLAGPKLRLLATERNVGPETTLNLAR
jgi:hypothetical protein